MAASICFLGTLSCGFRKKALTWRGLCHGFLALLIILAFSIGIATLLWYGIQALHPEYGSTLLHVVVNDNLLYALGFFSVALAVTTSVIAVARRRVTALDLTAGSLVIWFPVALMMVTVVPATSLLGTWVLLFSSLALLLSLAIESNKNAWIWSGLGFLTSAILATFLWVPLIYITLVSSGFLRLWLMMGEVALWLGAMLPILDRITSSKRWLLPAATLLIALGFLVAGHFLVGRDSFPPRVNSTQVDAETCSQFEEGRMECKNGSSAKRQANRN